MSRARVARLRSALARTRAALRQLLWRDTSGATFIEYLLICGIVALGAIVGYRHLRASSDGTVNAQGEVVRTLGDVNGSGGPIFPGLGTRDPTLGPGLGNVPISPLGPGRKGLPVLQPSKCFAAGTPVLTATGDRPIESLVPGELVLSRDEATGSDVLAPVAHLFVTPDTLVIGIQIPWDVGKASRIGVTPEHPFWVDGAGWVPARQLSGSPLASPARELQASSWARPSTPLLGTAVESWSQRTTVYNLEVEGQHSYFVGEAHVLVHNTCKYKPQTYNAWKADPTKPSGTEVNHLNQNAVYGTSKGGNIPYGQGISIPLTGGTNDVNGEHYKFHRSLEDFWDQYREGGALFGERPTNGDYGAAVEAALIAAGIPPQDAVNIAAEARQQRIDNGYDDDEPVPRIPGAFMKRKPPSAPADDENQG